MRVWSRALEFHPIAHQRRCVLGFANPPWVLCALLQHWWCTSSFVELCISILCVNRVLKDSIREWIIVHTFPMQYGHKGACQCEAALLPWRTVHLQTSSGCVTLPGQSVDVIQPLQEGDSKHSKYLWLYATILACSWLCWVVVYCACMRGHEKSLELC